MKRLRHVIGLLVLLVASIYLYRVVDGAALRDVISAVLVDPVGLALALGCYAAAFGLRSAVWCRVLPGLSAGQSWAALHVSLLGNHVLPLRLGEVLRVTSVLRRTELAAAPVLASAITLRGADLVAVLGLAALVAPSLVLLLAPGWVLGLFGTGLLALCAGGIGWSLRLRRDGAGVVLPGPGAPAAIVTAWALEAAVVYEIARVAGFGLGPGDAVAVTAVTIAVQAVAITPGGLGSYEAAATAVLVALGVPAGPAFAIALTTHAVKTLYALVVGGVALVAPAPAYLGRVRQAGGIPEPAYPGQVRGLQEPARLSQVHGPPGARRKPPSQARGLPPRVDVERMRLALPPWADLGRVRLPRRLPPRPVPEPTAPDAPVVVFMPAHDEQDSVGAVVAAIPARIAGRRVVTIVVDDGSADATAQRAAEAGARVLSLGTNQGLGAAVRRGLAQAVALRPAVVVYIDADGEYFPEDIAAVVEPVLAGRADYVIGSRFTGDIERMLARRRLGNQVLTGALRWVARRPDLTDGQSGYRAFSPAAAAAAEIVHDYNYAQVLTLDLLGKGFSYSEVPIRYRFRSTGTSFIRLGRYLRKVIPAVYRELNDDPDGRSRTDAPAWCGRACPSTPAAMAVSYRPNAHP